MDRERCPFCVDCAEQTSPAIEARGLVGGGVGRSGGGGVAFDVVGVPGEIAVEAVGDVGGESELVILVGVDDEFSGYAEALESLVHLLAAEDGDVGVDIAAEEERGSGNFGDVAESRNVFPDGGLVPRKA